MIVHALLFYMGFLAISASEINMHVPVQYKQRVARIA